MLARIDGQVPKVIGLMATAVVVGVLVGRPAPVPLAPATVAPMPAAPGESADLIVVHVSGEVAAPGLVEVPAGARVADVIAAAGGVTSGADLSQVNLAASVADEEQVVVPATGSKGSGLGVGAGGKSKIRINDADAVELESLPGVGPVLANAIVAYRTEYGSFRSVEDLLGVPGIGEQKLASMRDRVVVP